MDLNNEQQLLGTIADWNDRLYVRMAQSKSKARLENLCEFGLRAKEEWEKTGVSSYAKLAEKHPKLLASITTAVSTLLKTMHHLVEVAC